MLTPEFNGDILFLFSLCPQQDNAGAQVFPLRERRAETPPLFDPIQRYIQWRDGSGDKPRIKPL